MTCAVAEWLVDDPRHTHEQLVKIMHRYGDEFPHRGYGGMFGRWLEGHLTAPYNSFGNGSAMRVSPCGYYAKTLEEALELAQISAEVTHNHPEGIIGAQAVAATIFLLRNDEWIEKGKKFLKDFCFYEAVAATIFLLRNDEWIEKGKKFLKDFCFYDLDEIEKDWSDICKFYTFDVTCQGSVPEAIYCAIKNISSPMGYEKTIREAVSLGGDADTQGAIAGGIAAAVCEVPDKILKVSLSVSASVCHNGLRDFRIRRDKTQCPVD